jgi:hypothetical protein
VRTREVEKEEELKISVGRKGTKNKVVREGKVDI